MKGNNWQLPVYWTNITSTIIIVLLIYTQVVLNYTLNIFVYFKIKMLPKVPAHHVTKNIKNPMYGPPYCVYFLKNRF